MPPPLVNNVSPFFRWMSLSINTAAPRCWPYPLILTDKARLPGARLHTLLRLVTPAERRPCAQRQFRRGHRRIVNAGSQAFQGYLNGSPEGGRRRKMGGIIPATWDTWMKKATCTWQAGSTT